MEFSIYKLDADLQSFINLLSDHYGMRKVSFTRSQTIKNLGDYTISAEEKSDFYFRLDSNEKLITWYDY